MNTSKEGGEGYERKKRKNSFLLLTALTHIQDQLPFAVVGSREEIVVGGHKVRARQYPWGTVEGEWKEGGKREGKEGGGGGKGGGGKEKGGEGGKEEWGERGREEKERSKVYVVLRPHSFFVACGGRRSEDMASLCFLLSFLS